MEGIKELSMDGLKDATAKQKVDMGIQITGAGTYTINATELGVEEDVVLEDKFTHTFQDMKLNSTYSFTANAGTFNNRFVLHFTLTPAAETAMESVAVTEEVAEVDGVSVYTTTGQQVKVWVTNTAEFQNATVKVYDAIGNMVERKNMTSNELYLNLDIASGIYVVEVTGANKTFTKKVFITK
jgi:pullulanase/glycogen debranching enzyme